MNYQNYKLKLKNILKKIYMMIIENHMSEIQMIKE